MDRIRKRPERTSRRLGAGGLILGLLTLPGIAQAQSGGSDFVGNCEIAFNETAESYLNVGNVLARIPITGGLFYNGEPHVYRVPKDGSASALFGAGLNVAGLVNGEVRAAGYKHTSLQEFFPGPLDSEGRPPVDCSLYNRLFNVYTEDIASLESTGATTPDIEDWPRELGAPVHDGDGNPDNYNLSGGDRPEILGDQMIWWIMNDRGNAHSRFGTVPIGLEVRASAFAFKNTESGALSNATFYRYRIRNRNELPLRSAYAGLYVDADLGYGGDDLAGSDSTLGVAYYYNATNVDEGPAGYGEAPPAIGITLIRGPRRYVGGAGTCAERRGSELGLTGHMTGKPGAEAQSGLDLYNVLRGRWWITGEHMVIGDNEGDFGATGDSTDWIFPGDPVSGAYWSALNTNGAGTALTGRDERGYVTSGPYCLDPGEETEIVFAVIWSRGADHLDSIRQLRHETEVIQSLADAILTPVALPSHPVEESVFELGVHPNFPNPFSHGTEIPYELAEPEHVEITVTDVLGRHVATLVDARQETGPHRAILVADDLPAGVYFARIRIGDLHTTVSLVRTR